MGGIGGLSNFWLSPVCYLASLENRKAYNKALLAKLGIEPTFFAMNEEEIIILTLAKNAYEVSAVPPVQILRTKFFD